MKYSVYLSSLLLFTSTGGTTHAWRSSPLLRHHCCYYSTSLSSFRELSGDSTAAPPIPSADQLAKQQKLKKLAQDYQNTAQRRVLDDTVQFPSQFVIKIIGENDASFVQDILQAVSVATGIDESKLGHSTKPSTNGKHISITINPWFTSANQVYAAYAITGQDPRVKFVL